MGIGRLGLIFFMIGGMLFVVLRSGQTTYLVIQVVLLFSALFFGYRFGWKHKWNYAFSCER